MMSWCQSTSDWRSVGHGFKSHQSHVGFAQPCTSSHPELGLLWTQWKSWDHAASFTAVDVSLKRCSNYWTNLPVLWVRAHLTLDNLNYDSRCHLHPLSSSLKLKRISVAFLLSSSSLSIITWYSAASVVPVRPCCHGVLSLSVPASFQSSGS